MKPHYLCLCNFSLIFVYSGLMENGFMKTKHLFSVPLLLSGLMLLGLASCNSGSIVKRATGVPYEVLVVMDTNLWKGQVGEAVRDKLQESYPALPQAEPTAAVSYCEPASFNDFMRYVRNILLVDVNPSAYTKVSLVADKDVWSSGQQVMRLQSPSTDSLLWYLQGNTNDILAYIRQMEQKRYAQYLQENHNSLLAEKTRSAFQLDIYAPEEMNSSQTDSTFLWFSNNANSGRMDLIFYTFPAENADALEESHLIAMRDSVTQLHIPGSFEGSFMTTENRFPVEYESLENGKQPSAVIRGLWKMQGDMMGGPFVSYAWYDAPRHRIVVAEGFVYAPETNKKLYMHRLESALLTARIL